MTDFDAWWADVPQASRDNLDRAAARCPLELPRYPYWDAAICAEIVAWGELENDILRAHSAWLSRTKAHFEARGIEWTTRNLNAYSRLWAHE